MNTKHLLESNYFDMIGESAYTQAFKPQAGPFQCYNC